MQHKIFCVREFIKTESATAVQRAFRLRFNIQPPTRKSICRSNHQSEQIGSLCKGKSSGRQRASEEKWHEFKRVLSVAHAGQPVERAENLGYRNQLSGVCWGAVYCSIESIFFNNPVLYTKVLLYYTLLVLYRRVSCFPTTTQEQGWEQNVRWNVLVR